MNSSNHDSWQKFLKAPDEENFAPVFAATRDRAYTVCFRILACEEDAKDAFQSAYARLLALLGPPQQLPDDATPEVILRLAVLESENLRKRRGRRATREIAMKNVPDNADTAKGTLEEVSTRELRIRLETLVNTLHEDYRQPLLLHYFDGLSQREISSALGCPLSTVSWRIKRGLAKLRPLMKRAGLGDPKLLLAGLAGGAMLLTAPNELSAATVYTKAAAMAPAFATGGGAASLAGTTGTAIGGKFVAALVAATVIIGLVVYTQTSPPQHPPNPESPPSPQTAIVNPVPPPDSNQAQPTPAGPVQIATSVPVAETITKAILAEGIVVDIFDTPVEGATVYTAGDEPKTSITTADGRFSIDLAPLGEAVLYATKENTTSAPLEVAAPADHLKLILKNGADLEGRVYNVSTGLPVEGATVELRIPPVNFWGMSSSSTLGDRYLNAISGKNGKYLLENAAEGVYLVSAKKDALVPVNGDRVGQTQIFLGEGDRRSDFDLFVFPGNTIVGVVKDADSDTVIPGARVYATEMGPEREVFSDSDGKFRIDGIVGLSSTTISHRTPEGKTVNTGSPMSRIPNLAAEADGYSFVMVDKVTLSILEPEADTALLMRKAVSVSGIVVDEAGDPVVGAEVTRRPHGMVTPRTFTDSTGLFELDAPVGSKATISAKAEGYEEYESSALDLEAGLGVEDLRITMSPVVPKKHFRGIVRDQYGNAVGGQAVFISVKKKMPNNSSIWSRLTSATTDSSGRFQIEAPEFVSPEKMESESPAGESDVVVNFLSDGPFDEVDIAAGDVASPLLSGSIKLTRADLESGRDIELRVTTADDANTAFAGGYVFDSDRDPVPGVAVGIGRLMTFTNGKGYFHLTDIPNNTKSLILYDPQTELSFVPIELNSDVNNLTLTDTRRTITINILDSMTGEPIYNDVIVLPLSSVGGVIENRTNGRFVHKLARGQELYGYRILAKGYETLETEYLEFPYSAENRTTSVEFRLEAIAQ